MGFFYYAKPREGSGHVGWVLARWQRGQPAGLNHVLGTCVCYRNCMFEYKCAVAAAAAAAIKASPWYLATTKLCLCLQLSAHFAIAPGDLVPTVAGVL